MNGNILFFVKFGKREHLEQLKNGKIYFSNAGRFIALEKEQQKKGQGDASEGRMFLSAYSVELRNPDTDELVATLNNANMNIGFEGLDKVPLFCLTAGFQDDCEVFRSYNDYKVKFSQEKVNIISEHFSEADSALLIKTPAIFIKDVKNVFAGDCYSNLVRYFNMSILTTDRLSFLFETKDVLTKNMVHSITTENVYRHLYCKDLYFKEQQEYRFIAPFQKINKPTLFDIEMNSETELYDIDNFFSGVEIKSKF